MARIQNQGAYPLKTPISLAGLLIGTDPEDSNRTKNYLIGDLVTFLSSLGLQNGTLKGEIVWNSGRTFLTSDLEYFINDLAYTTLRSSVTLEAADLLLPRIDLITVDTNNLVTFQTGIPAATPKEPLIEDPTQKVKLTAVRLEALATQPTGITKDLMYDENVGTGGGEWDVTPTVGSTAFFDLASPLDPDTGAVSILLLNSSPTGDALSFSLGVTLDIVDFTNIHFYFKTTETLQDSAKIQVSFYNGATQISSKVTISPGTYSLAGSNISTYQGIIIPKDDFDFNDIQYTSIVFAFENLPTASVFFDTFNILGGIENPPRYGTVKALADIPDSFVDKATYVPVINTNEAGFELMPLSTFGDNIYIADGSIPATTNRLVSIGVGSQIIFIGDELTSVINENTFKTEATEWELVTPEGIEGGNIISDATGIMHLIAQNTLGITLETAGTPTTPTIGQVLSVASVVGNEGILEWSTPSGGVPEAPIDGTVYGRIDAGWSALNNFVTLSGNQSIGGIKTFTNSTNAIVLTGVTGASTAASLFIEHDSTAGHAILLKGNASSAGNIFEIRDNVTTTFTITKLGLATSDVTPAQVTAGSVKTVPTKEWVNQLLDAVTRYDGYALSAANGIPANALRVETDRVVGITVYTSVRINLNTADTTTIVTVDVKKNGVSIFATLVTIDATELTSTTAAVPFDFTASASSITFLDDDEISFDVSNVTDATGLKIKMIE